MNKIKHGCVVITPGVESDSWKKVIGTNKPLIYNQNAIWHLLSIYYDAVYIPFKWEGVKITWNRR